MWNSPCSHYFPYLPHHGQMGTQTGTTHSSPYLHMASPWLYTNGLCIMPIYNQMKKNKPSKKQNFDHREMNSLQYSINYDKTVSSLQVKGSLITMSSSKTTSSNIIQVFLFSKRCSLILLINIRRQEQ